MPAITIEVPDENFAMLKSLAEKEQISLQEFTDRAPNDAIDARRQLDYLMERANGGKMEKSPKVPNFPPNARG